MRTLPRLALSATLFAAVAGCDSAMVDATPKPEITGRGPGEPDAPGKSPGTGNVDLGEVRGGPLRTRPQEGPGTAPKPEPPSNGKVH